MFPAYIADMQYLPSLDEEIWEILINLPVLADISNEMLDQGNAFSSTYSKHHHTQAYTEHQKKMLSLSEVMDAYNVNLNCEATRKGQHSKFINERLQPVSS